MNFHEKRDLGRFFNNTSVDIQFDDGIFICFYYFIPNPADLHKRIFFPSMGYFFWKYFLFINVTEHPLLKHISINFISGPAVQNVLIVAYFYFLKQYFGIFIWFGIIDDSIINNSAKCATCIDGPINDIFFILIFKMIEKFSFRKKIGWIYWTNILRYVISYRKHEVYIRKLFILIHVVWILWFSRTVTDFAGLFWLSLGCC